MIIDDTIVRVLMTHKILEDGLSPMEALAYVLRGCGANLSETAEIMSKMCKRNVTSKTVTSYVTRAKRKLAENEIEKARDAPEEQSE